MFQQMVLTVSEKLKLQNQLEPLEGIPVYQYISLRSPQKSLIFAYILLFIVRYGKEIGLFIITGCIFFCIVDASPMYKVTKTLFTVSHMILEE